MHYSSLNQAAALTLLQQNSGKASSTVKIGLAASVRKTDCWVGAAVSAGMAVSACEIASPKSKPSAWFVNVAVIQEGVAPGALLFQGKIKGWMNQMKCFLTKYIIFYRSF